MTVALVDFHCHLDLFADMASAVADADRAGVYTLTVTTTPKAWPRNHEVTQPTRHVRAALGLHPQLVVERSPELSIWEEYLQQTRYVGEVGIDAGPRYYRSLDLQKEVFERILRCCATAGNKVLTVHSVRAATIVLDLIGKHLPSTKGRVVLHWFTGSKSEAKRAVKLGCYFSINNQMLLSDRGRDLVASLPLDRLLTETDGPFTQVSGRPMCPRDVAHAVEGVAALRKMTSAEVAAVIRGNLKDIIGSP
jgi:TatD DNase family protein